MKWRVVWTIPLTRGVSLNSNKTRDYFFPVGAISATSFPFYGFPAVLKYIDFCLHPLWLGIPTKITQNLSYFGGSGLCHGSVTNGCKYFHGEVKKEWNFPEENLAKVFQTLCFHSFFWCTVKWRARRPQAGSRLSQFTELLECGRWSLADADDARQDTYDGCSPGRCWMSGSGVWLIIPVSLISTLFLLLSQPFISIFIPQSLILQCTSCDWIGCSNDSLGEKPITE